jgi:hypothetical protein
MSHTHDDITFFFPFSQRTEFPNSYRGLVQASSFLILHLVIETRDHRLSLKGSSHFVTSGLLMQGIPTSSSPSIPKEIKGPSV